MKLWPTFCDPPPHPPTAPSELPTRRKLEPSNLEIPFFPLPLSFYLSRAFPSSRSVFPFLPSHQPSFIFGKHLRRGLDHSSPFKTHFLCPFHLLSSGHRGALTLSQTHPPLETYFIHASHRHDPPPPLAPFSRVDPCLGYTPPIPAPPRRP